MIRVRLPEMSLRAMGFSHYVGKRYIDSVDLTTVRPLPPRQRSTLYVFIVLVLFVVAQVALTGPTVQILPNTAR